MQKKRDLIEQPLGRAGVLDDDGLGKAPQLLLFVAGQRPAGVHDHGRKRHPVLLGHLLQQLVAIQVGQVQVHHHAVERGAAQVIERGGGGAGAHNFHILAAEQVPHALALALVVFHHQHAAQVLGEFGFQPLQGLHQLFAFDGLERIANRASSHGLLGIVGHRRHMHRDVAGSGVALELVEHTQARKIGQIHIQHNGAGQALRCKSQAVGRVVGQMAFKVHLTGEVAQDLGKTLVVLDHQNAARPGANRDRLGHGSDGGS